MVPGSRAGNGVTKASLPFSAGMIFVATVPCGPLRVMLPGLIDWTVNALEKRNPMIVSVGTFVASLEGNEPPR